MVVFCSKCSIPLDSFDTFEGAEGRVFTCPVCGEAVMYEPYASKQEYCVTYNSTFTEDEKTYLNHIIDKQIGKLEGGKNTLITAKNKINGEY